VSSLTQVGALQPGYALGRCSGAVFLKGAAKTAVIYRFANDPASCAVTDPLGKTTNVTGLAAGWNVRGM
jgi:hypothetical protein